MFPVPESNLYWIVAIYAVAIVFGILALAAFLLAVDAAVSSTLGVTKIRIRVPKRSHAAEVLRNVEPVDPEKARQILDSIVGYSRQPARVLPYERSIKVEVR